MDIRNGEHFAHMLQNFANNDDLIEQTNAKKLSYTLGHNAYSHMSNEEFNEYFNLGKGMPARPAPEAIHEAPANLTATAVDWTTKTGVVTPGKSRSQSQYFPLTLLITFSLSLIHHSQEPRKLWFMLVFLCHWWLRRQIRTTSSSNQLLDWIL